MRLLLLRWHLLRWKLGCRHLRRHRRGLRQRWTAETASVMGAECSARRHYSVPSAYCPREKNSVRLETHRAARPAELAYALPADHPPFQERRSPMSPTPASYPVRLPARPKTRALACRRRRVLHSNPCRRQILRPPGYCWRPTAPHRLCRTCAPPPWDRGHAAAAVAMAEVRRSATE